VERVPITQASRLPLDWRERGAGSTYRPRWVSGTFHGFLREGERSRGSGDLTGGDLSSSTEIRKTSPMEVSRLSRSPESNKGEVERRGQCR
jgi:hypothetical protein